MMKLKYILATLLGKYLTFTNIYEVFVDKMHCCSYSLELKCYSQFRYQCSEITASDWVVIFDF